MSFLTVLDDRAPGCLDIALKAGKSFRSEDDAGIDVRRREDVAHTGRRQAVDRRQGLGYVPRSVVDRGHEMAMNVGKGLPTRGLGSLWAERQLGLPAHARGLSPRNLPRSASTIILTSCSNPIRGSHLRSSCALRPSARRWSTSAGRSRAESTRTWSSQ